MTHSIVRAQAKMIIASSEVVANGCQHPSYPGDGHRNTTDGNPCGDRRPAAAPLRRPAIAALEPLILSTACASGAQSAHARIAPDTNW